MTFWIQTSNFPTRSELSWSEFVLGTKGSPAFACVSLLWSLCFQCLGLIIFEARIFTPSPDSSGYLCSLGVQFWCGRYHKLVIVDTTAAPALFLVDRLNMLGRCVALWNIPNHNEDFHTFQAIGEIKVGNARFHALSQFDLHRFDQNILSLENS